jgi:hypothetical protein
MLPGTLIGQSGTLADGLDEASWQATQSRVAQRGPKYCRRLTEMYGE